MKQALSATLAAKRTALVAVLLIPAAILQTFLISSLSWWHVPLLRLVNVGALALLSAILLRRAILKAGESAVWMVRILGLGWSAAFLVSGLLGRDPAGVLFGALCAFFGTRASFRALQELRSAAYDSGVLWYQGAPRQMPGVQVDIHRIGEDERIATCPLVRLDDRGVFVLLPPGAEFKAGEYQLRLRGAQMELHQPARLHLTWSRSGNRGAGFLFSKLNQAAISKPIGDWMNRLEGRGYEQLG